jgi:uncharacterized protein with ParB-like and HNH nuclease domain
MAKHLDTDKKYIKDLFSSNSFYNVPEYQRPYVWGEEQVSALLNDICNALDKDEDKEYFLGCMVWNTKTKDENGIKYAYQDILDGQQRFITLYLTLAVIRDITHVGDMKMTINEQMKQHGNKYKNIPERDRIIFDIRADAKFLEKYVIKPDGTLLTEQIKTEALNKTNSRSVRNMAVSILGIRKWWHEKAAEEMNIQEKIESFFSYLLNKVLILYIATPDNLDDAYNLFTILNGRGIQLQPSDILKAQNLRLITDEVRRKHYAEQWSDYEGLFGSPFASFDAFLSALVDVKMKYRSDDNMSLAIAFENMYKRRLVEKGEGVFLLAEKYIKHYQTILNWEDRNEENHFYFDNIVHILSSTSISKFMPSLMHYRECFGDYRMMEFLIKLDNIISVMWIIGKRDSDTRLFILLRKMEECLELHKFSKEKAADEFLKSSVLEYGYEHPNANTAIPIQEFFDTLEHEQWGNFSGNRINKVKYLLLKLDLICGNKNTKINYQPHNSSLEHVLPQTTRKTDWKVPVELHEIWCHRLGNLVLLDRRRNVVISNSVYSVKKSKYSNSIENRAYTNKLFIDYNTWTIDDLIQNHHYVVSLLKEYYSGNSLQTLLNFHKK